MYRKRRLHRLFVRSYGLPATCFFCNRYECFYPTWSPLSRTCRPYRSNPPLDALAHEVTNDSPSSSSMSILISMFPSPFDLSAVTEDVDYEETSRIYRFGTPRILDQDTLVLEGAVCWFLFREDLQSSGLALKNGLPPAVKSLPLVLRYLRERSHRCHGEFLWSNSLTK